MTPGGIGKTCDYFWFAINQQVKQRSSECNYWKAAIDEGGQHRKNVQVATTFNVCFKDIACIMSEELHLKIYSLKLSNIIYNSYDIQHIYYVLYTTI